MAIINLKNRGYSMGFIKYFDLPEKKAGESLNTADRAYLIKLIVVMGLVTASLSFVGQQILLERHIARMGNSAKALMEWSKKADFANEMLEDLFRVQQVKESYERQGIGADEAIINNNKPEVLNEK